MATGRLNKQQTRRMDAQVGETGRRKGKEGDNSNDDNDVELERIVFVRADLQCLHICSLKIGTNSLSSIEQK